MYYFKDYLKNLRKERGITQSELSELLGISISTVRTIECGKTSIPKKKLLSILASFENKTEIEVLSEIIFGFSSPYPENIKMYICLLYTEGYSIISFPKDCNNSFVLCLKANSDRTIQVTFPDKDFYLDLELLNSFFINTIYQFELSQYSKLHFVLDYIYDSSKTFADSLSIINKGKISKKQVIIFDTLTCKNIFIYK